MNIRLTKISILKFLIVFFILFQTYGQNKIMPIPGLLPVLALTIVLIFCLSYFSKYNKISLPRECKRFLLYVLIMIPFGIIDSPSISNHLNRCVYIAAYTGIMCSIVYICLTEKSPDFILKAMLLNAIVLTVSFLHDPVHLLSGRYSLTVDVNPNALGMSLMVGVWCAVCLWRKQKVAWYFLGILVPVFVYGILLTGSLKSVITILIFFITDYIILTRSLIQQKSGRKLCRFIDLLIFIAIVITVGILLVDLEFLYSNSIVGSRVFEILSGTASDKRERLYLIGIEMIKEYPLFGVGFDGYQFYNGGYSHSTLIEVLVSGGLLGGLLFFTNNIYMCHKYFKRFSYAKKCGKRELIEYSGSAIVGMSIMIALMFVIIHPYEMIANIGYAICIVMGNINILDVVDDRSCVYEDTYSCRSKTSVYQSCSWFQGIKKRTS